jgi:hypothetical protein
MPEGELIGFVASALVLATFAMKDMRRLRVTAIVSNVAFIAYATFFDLLPILILHVLLLPLNVVRLRDECRAASPACHSIGREGSRERSRLTWWVATAAGIVIAVGLVGLWLIPGAHQDLLVQVESEPAVSDTPFDDVISSDSKMPNYSPHVIPPNRDVAAAAVTRLDARARARGKSGVGLRRDGPR